MTIKHDQEKLRPTLLPMDALNEVIKVLEFGATKYSVIKFFNEKEIEKKIRDSLWQKLKIALDVELKKQSWLKGYAHLAIESQAHIKGNVVLAEKQNMSCQKIFYVDLAMKKNDWQVDLKSLMIDKFIKQNIVKPQNLKQEKENEREKEEHAQTTLKHKGETLFYATLQNMELTNTSIKIFWNKDVQCAEVQKDRILITTIKLERFEVCFVVSAIKDLDCYRITLQLLKAYFNISININEISNQKSGVDNWKTVPDGKQRYLDAFLRHGMATASGEKLDPDSGLPHMAHAVCCGLFYLWFDQYGDQLVFPDDESRIDAIGQNGGDGEHYEQHNNL